MFLTEKTLDEKIISDTDKLFFVGTTKKGYDISLQQFNDYKSFSSITTDKAAFGTSTYEYALSYASQYASKDNPGVIVAFELKPGTKVFDLRSKEDYESIGLDGELANIFLSCEPYFAINLQIPHIQKHVEPIEFTIAKQMIETSQNNINADDDKEFDSISFLKKLKSMDFSTSFDFLNYYVQQMLKAFTRILGKRKIEEYINLIKLEKFDSLEQMLERLGLDETNGKFATKENIAKMTELRRKKSEKNGKKFKNAGANDFYFYKVYDQGGKYHWFFKNLRRINLFPKEIISSEYATMFHNYCLLYQYVEFTKGADSYGNLEPFGQDPNQVLRLNAYMKLFKMIKEYLNSNVKNSLFKNGILRIKNRLASDDRSHIYIDYIQYVFFSRIVDNSDYIGIFCPEIRGYSAIHNTSTKGSLIPYGYYNKIDAKTLNFNDRTVILCKPIDKIVGATFGHTVNFIDNANYHKDVGTNPEDRIRNSDFLELKQHIDKMNSVSQYKNFYNKYMDIFNQ